MLKQQAEQFMVGITSQQFPQYTGIFAFLSAPIRHITLKDDCGSHRSEVEMLRDTRATELTCWVL